MVINIFDERGKPINLQDNIGQGGEARVYRIKGQPDSVAKIYEGGPRSNYTEKLAWMVAHPPGNPTGATAHASLAWPGGLLYDGQRRMVGYWMPYVREAAPILNVYIARRRIKILPNFDNRYLHRSARNLAAALGSLHRSGYVVGDLNESNVLVTPSALITLIDTDSFQVEVEKNGKKVVHPCPVAKLEYTPPELQGVAMSKVVRLPEHDAFGLAVLTFQLLMGGSHPFRAEWLGKGEPPPLEERIAQGAFPYTANPGSPVKPPPGAPDFNSLHPGLAELFRRCFVDAHNDASLRPSPAAWESAIIEAEQALICCEAGHYYSSHLSRCPACGQVGVKRQPSPRPSEKPRQPAAGARPAAQSTTGRPPGNPSPASSAPVGGTPAGSAAPGAASRRPQGAAPSQGAARRPSAGARPGTPGGRPFGWRRAWWSNFPPPAPQPAAASASPPGSGSRTTAATPAGTAPWITPPAWWPAGAGRFDLQAWLRPRLTRSLTTGASLGLLSGAVTGAGVGLIAGYAGETLAASLVWTLGGSVAGLLRGYHPGQNMGVSIERYLGWRRFWKFAGMLTGAVVGTAVGFVFAILIFPIFLGMFTGGWTGALLGERLWRAGSRYGWHRLWVWVGGLGAAAMGALLGWWLAIGPLGALASQGMSEISTWLLLQNAAPAVEWALLGALSGGLGGAFAGGSADLFSRLTGLRE